MKVKRVAKTSFPNICNSGNTSQSHSTICWITPTVNLSSVFHPHDVSYFNAFPCLTSPPLQWNPSERNCMYTIPFPVGGKPPDPLETRRGNVWGFFWGGERKVSLKNTRGVLIFLKKGAELRLLNSSPHVLQNPEHCQEFLGTLHSQREPTSP